MRSKLIILLGIILININSLAAQKKAEKKFTHNFELEINAELKYYIEEASFSNQEDFFPSIAFQPEYNLEWNKGYESINFKGFFRLDKDKERTHADIRELYYQKVKNKWELNIGLKKVFWGVTESNHLVDIINQTDNIESFDGEQKLGQPMVQFVWSTDNIGNFDFFYLPYHRKGTFTGKKGRLRFPSTINKSDITYESDAKEWYQDFAVRWSHSFSIIDIGISHFYGTGRELLFNFDQQGNSNAFYPIINQSGIDLQITHDAFLWKVESIIKTNSFQDVFAYTAGLEYTFSNVKNSGIDLSLLGEYLYDDRAEVALNSLQNDAFFGMRVAFNDTQNTSFLIGTIKDLKNSSQIFSVEASRRISDSFKIELEGRFFSNIDNDELILTNFRNDSFISVNLFKYF